MSTNAVNSSVPHNTNARDNIPGLEPGFPYERPEELDYHRERTPANADWTDYNLRRVADREQWIMRQPDLTWRIVADKSVRAVVAVMMPDLTPTEVRAEVEKLAASEDIAVDYADLDYDSGVLWCGGVCIDLADSRDYPVACPPEAGIPHLRASPYVPDMSVPTPGFDRVCELVWPGKADREHALDSLAHGFHGNPTDFAVIGRSATGRGKTLVTSIMRAVLGNYAGQVSASTLFGRGANDAFAYSEMDGYRLVVMDEGVKADFASVQTFKRVVNPVAVVEARKRHEAAPRTIQARHTIVVTVNPDTDMGYGDPAIVRRLVPMCFDGDPRAIAEFAPDYMAGQFHDEAPGILARMIVRCSNVMGTRPVAPESSRAWLDAVVEETSTVATWAAARTIPGKSTTTDLYADYAAWADTSGHLAVTRNPVFGKKLAELGYQPVKIGHDSARGWNLSVR
jgi:hypothetical protein